MSFSRKNAEAARAEPQREPNEARLVHGYRRTLMGMAHQVSLNPRRDGAVPLPASSSNWAGAGQADATGPSGDQWGGWSGGTQWGGWNYGGGTQWGGWTGRNG